LTRTGASARRTASGSRRPRFDLGDDGIAFVVGSDAAGTDAAGTDAAAAVREAEAACPSTAISVLEA